MISARPSRLGPRLLAILVLLVLILLAWNLLIAPFVTLAVDRKTDIATLSDRLERLHAVIARIPHLRGEAASLQAKLAAEGGLWTGSSSTFVATSIQSKIRDAIGSGSGHIRSTAELKGTDEAGLRRVRVHVVIDGTLETVVRTLAGIQATRPPIFVENLTISSPAHIAVDKPPMLTLDLDVLGYMRAGAK